MENKNKILASVLVLLLLFLVVLTGIFYSSLTGFAIKESTPKIGIILPLTGNTAYVGEWVRQGIELAASDLEKQNKPIELIYEDDACDPKNSVTALNKLIETDNIGIVLGPVCSSSILSTAPIAEKNGIILFSSVATSSKITDAGDYIFRDRESDALHGTIIAEFAYNTLGAKKAAILFLNLDNGVGFKEAFKKKFTELGGYIIEEQSFESKDTDYKTQLAKIKESNPDVLYFAGQKMENAILQAKQLGLNQQILGPSTMQTDSLLKVLGDAAEGIIYTYPDFDLNAEQTNDYNQKYKEKYNKSSEAYAANSYDALMILYKAMEKCGTKNNNCIKDYLYSIKDYKGVSGTFSIDINGDVQRNLAIKTVRNGKFVDYN
jgi:branched-chain amino acid transport system substrate-binding protein